MLAYSLSELEFFSGDAALLPAELLLARRANFGSEGVGNEGVGKLQPPMVDVKESCWRLGRSGAACDV
jgi:hypothetical protein